MLEVSYFVYIKTCFPLHISAFCRSIVVSLCQSRSCFDTFRGHLVETDHLDVEFFSIDSKSCTNNQERKFEVYISSFVDVGSWSNAQLTFAI